MTLKLPSQYPIGQFDGKLRLMKIIKGSLSDVILLALEKTVDGYIRVEDFLYNTHIYAKGYERHLNKSALSKALRRLREKGLVETYALSDKLAYKLTVAGQNLTAIRYFDEKNWDGIWRVVIFDIPENRRRIRRILRDRLKVWGFVPWQKSVWASQRNIARELDEIIKELQIEEWVIVLESKNISKTLS